MTLSLHQQERLLALADQASRSRVTLDFNQLKACSDNQCAHLLIEQISHPTSGTIQQQLLPPSSTCVLCFAGRQLHTNKHLPAQANTIQCTKMLASTSMTNSSVYTWHTYVLQPLHSSVRRGSNINVAGASLHT